MTEFRRLRTVAPRAAVAACCTATAFGTFAAAGFASGICASAAGCFFTARLTSSVPATAGASIILFAAAAVAAATSPITLRGFDFPLEITDELFSCRDDLLQLVHMRLF